MVQTLGLGFANPELKRAQMLAQLNGSTKLPMNPGMGPPPVSPDIQGGPQAGPMQAPQPMPQQQMPQTAQVPINIPPPTPEMISGNAQQEAPEEEGGVPKWAKIAGALGHVLLSIDAGYHGRGMPGAPDYLDPQKEQDQAMQVSEFLVNTTARAWEVSRKAPAGMREKMLDQFKSAISKVAPDFDFDGFINSMQSDAERMDDLAPDLATLSEDAKRQVMAQIDARGGDARAASDVIKDETFMKGVMTYEDQRNGPSLKAKLAAIKQAMAKTGMPGDILSDATPDGFRQFNENLPERSRLSPSEIGTLRRNPDLQRIIGLGRPPEQRGEEPTLDSRAGRQPRAAPVGRPDPGDEMPDDGYDIQEPVAPVPPRRRAEPPRVNRSEPPKAPSQPKRRPQAPPPSPEDEGGGNAFLDGLAARADEAQQEFQRRGGKAEDFVPRAKAESDRMNKWLEQHPEADRYPGEQEQRPPARGARKPEGRQPPQQPQGQRFKVPKDITLPGLGPVKAGDTVIYDEATRKYRRG